jgi:hypothetical protein
MRCLPHLFLPVRLMARLQTTPSRLGCCVHAAWARMPFGSNSSPFQVTSAFDGDVEPREATDAAFLCRGDAREFWRLPGGCCRFRSIFKDTTANVVLDGLQNSNSIPGGRGMGLHLLNTAHGVAQVKS